MKELILYYSVSGKSRQYAEKRAKENDGDLIEVKEQKQRGKLGVVSGCLQAMRGKGSAVQPIEADWATYDRVVLCGPIWAGKPAPAVNGAAALIPAGKTVALVMTSGGGNGQLDRLAEQLRQQGCTVDSTSTIKG